MAQTTRKPLFSMTGNRIGGQVQRFYLAQPAFCADHGLPAPKTVPLPASWEIDRVIRERLKR
jgi:hypothetical protein